VVHIDAGAVRYGNYGIFILRMPNDNLLLTSCSKNIGLKLTAKYACLSAKKEREFIDNLLPGRE
jgi:hypothetical protein